MEYCEGLDLRRFINEHKEKNQLIDELLIYYFIYDICHGLNSIHNKNLIHRDLKPDNLFITGENRLKIGDFGISKQLKSEKEFAKTQTGTMLYMAPEIINGKEYNKKVDMWALGCIIHELCTLNFCFNDNSYDDLKKKITSSNHEKIDQNKYSKDLQNIIDLLLEIDYNKRPNVEEIIKIVENFFIKNFLKSMQSELENDEIYQNYRLEKSILIAIDQIHINILKRENIYNQVKVIFIYSIMAYPTALAIISSISGGLGYFIGFAVCILYSKFSHYLIGKQEKEDFIKSNYLIFSHIENNLIEIINKKLDKKFLKEQLIYIYNEENLKIQITKIKNKLI